MKLRNSWIQMLKKGKKNVIGICSFPSLGFVFSFIDFIFRQFPTNDDKHSPANFHETFLPLALIRLIKL